MHTGTNKKSDYYALTFLESYIQWLLPKNDLLAKSFFFENGL